MIMPKALKTREDSDRPYVKIEAEERVRLY